MDAADLVGQWELVSMAEFDEDGRPQDGPLGPAARGRLYYGADGYMSVHLMRGDSEPGYIGYSGGWRLEDGRIVHRVAVSSDPSWVGGDQVRSAEMVRGLLVLGRRDGTFRARLAWRRLPVGDLGPG
ncbi:lipocalin-like domain-containing protein [Actinomadura rubrisoli]|uniref:Lipocalin-like domain-containing protein n=1 Tax=Actinomadura rubrisoli TaxID=2530368 RepID=A0A4R5AUL7_9ACTN|nr:lipocalin-like domain-containing protein [Actinomadura rubrisoli]TDD74272.1 hypothetical protein E1298_32765 [Actinomadura rubrisoli]